MSKKEQLSKILFSFFLIMVFIGSVPIHTQTTESKTDTNNLINVNKSNEKLSNTNNAINSEKLRVTNTNAENSLQADQWSYLTKTYTMNDLGWTAIDNATKDILPFSQRYRINYGFNNWDSLLATNPGLPYKLANISINQGTKWFSNQTASFTLNPSFVPNFKVNATIYVNDTNTAGNVDLYVYDNYTQLVGSSSLVNLTDTVIFTPTDTRNYTFVIDFPASVNFPTSNVTLEINQNVDQTKYGMTPGYIPTMPLTYTNNNIPKGTSLWTNETSDFPYVLRFIPDYPVTVNLNVVNTTTDGEADLFVYNSIGLLVGQSTNLNPSQDSVIFTPTKEDPYVIEVRHPASDTITNTRIILTIIENINPNMFVTYVGDDGKQYDSFNWHFTNSINSFGVVTPNTLDIKDVTAMDTISGTGEFNYANIDYTTPGVQSVYDNESWDPSELYFHVTGTTSCNGLLPAIDQCNGFLPVLFSSNDLTDLGSNGLWTSMNNKDNTYGANPQILKFVAYYGAGSVASPLVPDTIVVKDSSDNIVYQLTSNDIKKTAISSFADSYQVKIPAQIFDTGDYKLEFESSQQVVYQYSFHINDNIYGNLFDTAVLLGYEQVDNEKTLVFVKTSDIDTTTAQLEFSYTTDGSTWSPARNMTLIEGNSYGFIINNVASAIKNVTVKVYDSAPSDQGTTRFKIRNTISQTILDLNTENNITLSLRITPYGDSPVGMNITFSNINNVKIVPQTGTIVKTINSFIYQVSGLIPSSSEQLYVFKVFVKNPADPQTVGITASSGLYMESRNIQFTVLGQTPPTLDAVIGTLPTVYNNLFSTYNFTLEYSFTGGSPATSASINILSTGSVNDLNIPLDVATIFPATVYTMNISMSTSPDFIDSSDSLTITFEYDSQTEDQFENIEVNPVMSSEIFSLTVIDAPILSETGSQQNIPTNISIQSNIALPIDNLVISIDTNGQEYSVTTNNINVGSFSGNQNKYVSITFTFPSTFAPESTDYNIPLALNFLSMKVNYVITLNTDFVETTSSNSTSTNPSSTTTSSSAPPTPGFEYIFAISTIITLIIIRRRNK